MLAAPDSFYKLFSEYRAIAQRIGFPVPPKFHQYDVPDILQGVGAMVRVAVCSVGVPNVTVHNPIFASNHARPWIHPRRPVTVLMWESAGWRTT